MVTDLTGPYQFKNISTVLEAVWCWNKYYPKQRISDTHVLQGLREVKKSTSMIGRWMVIQETPLIITDAAHNSHGMQAMLPDLFKIPARKRHFVLGFVSDKDIQKILSMFPDVDMYYWVSPDIPRGKPALETKEIGFSLGLEGKAYASVFEGYLSALQAAEKDDLIFVGGSSYVVGDFLAGLQKKQ
jgi:dihydrofolate synthase/folylpolyglutamate synthase